MLLSESAAVSVTYYRIRAVLVAPNALRVIAWHPSKLFQVTTQCRLQLWRAQSGVHLCGYSAVRAAHVLHKKDVLYQEILWAQQPNNLPIT